MKLIVLSILFTLSANLSFAAGGGSDPGGGTPIESGFKAKLIAVAKTAKELQKKQRTELKFDPFALYASITMPNGVSPLCEADLSKLHGKMAYVVDPSTRIISLDCTQYSLKTWQVLFKSEAVADSVFFLHEALRISPSGDLSDNDYVKSSSYIAAVESDPGFIQDLKNWYAEYRKNKIAAANEELANESRMNDWFAYFLSGHSLCSVKVQYTNIGDPYYLGSTSMSFFVNGKLMDQSEIDDVDNYSNYVISKLVGTSHAADRHFSIVDEFKDRVFREADQAGCFN